MLKDVFIGHASCGLQQGGQDPEVRTGLDLGDHRVQIRKVEFSHDSQK